MKKAINAAAHWLLADFFLVGLYWACESHLCTRLYATGPVAIVAGVLALLSFCWVVLTKRRAWLVVLLPATALASIGLLAMVTIWLKGLSL